MTVLTVPTCVLVDDEANVNPTNATMERPLQVQVGAILADGTPVDPATQPLLAGFEVLRQHGPAVEVFDATAGTWAPDHPDPARQATPLTYTPGGPRPWAGVLIGSTLKGLAATDDVFVRAVAAPALDPAARVTGGPSGRVRLRSMKDAMRAGLVLDPDKPESATSIEMVLRDGALNQVGVVRLSTAGGGCVVEISNSAGASVVLRDNGDIELTPGGGAAVHVNADLVASRLFRSAGGGAPVEVT
jgi:hypothetical protein